MDSIQLRSSKLIFILFSSNVTKIHVILMQNLISFNEKYIKRIFDLKGSEVDRVTKGIENVNKMQALKDQDFKWMKKVNDGLIDFNKHHADFIEETIHSDLNMLVECDLMDYSLLLIIIEKDDSNPESKLELEKIFSEQSRMIRRIFPSSNGKYLYVLGIIDYLQKYNFKKAIEHRLKKLVHDDRASAVDSKLYAYRLSKFTTKHLLDPNIS